MFLALISSVCAGAPFNYHNKQYSLVPLLDRTRAVGVGGDNKLAAFSAEYGGIVSLEPGQDGYTVLKINGGYVCDSDSELKLCKPMKSPTMFRIKEKENTNEGVAGYRLKLATTNPFDKIMEKCVYLNGRALGITKCTGSDNLAQMWDFREKNEEPNKTTKPGKDEGSVYPSLPSDPSPGPSGPSPSSPSPSNPNPSCALRPGSCGPRPGPSYGTGYPCYGGFPPAYRQQCASNGRPMPGSPSCVSGGCYASAGPQTLNLLPPFCAGTYSHSQEGPCY